MLLSMSSDGADPAERRTIDELEARVAFQEVILERIAAELTELVGSGWLRALEWCEVPVRVLRPGLGTVRVRLEAIRRAARGHVSG
jgi:hypothetical protein